MTVNRRTSLIVLLLLALVAGGCTATPPKPTPSPSPETDALHPYPELEAQLPNEIGGITLLKASIVVDPRRQGEKTLEVLRLLGKTPQDMQIASAAADGLDFEMYAQRIVGSTAADAVIAFKNVDEAEPTTTVTYTPQIINGKHILTRSVTGQTTYIYALADIMFVVSGRRAFVEEALGKLN